MGVYMMNRPTAEDIQLFVTHSLAIAGLGRDDDESGRYFSAAQIVAGGFRLTQVDILNAFICGVTSLRWRKGTSTANRPMPPAAEAEPLFRAWEQWVDSTIVSVASDRIEEQERFAWTVHDTLLCIRPFKDCNGRTARLALNDVRRQLNLPWLTILDSDARKYLEHLDRFRDREFSSWLADVSSRYRRPEQTVAA
jgi:hypothetical protein